MSGGSDEAASSPSSQMLQLLLLDGGRQRRTRGHFKLIETEVVCAAEYGGEGRPAKSGSCA